MAHHDDYDDDVPFRLPKEPGQGDDEDIHKADTDDIQVTPEEVYGGRTEPRERTEDVEAAHASDQPSEDDDFYRQETEPYHRDESGDRHSDSSDRTMQHESVSRDDDESLQYTQDTDVPFRLPKEPERRSASSESQGDAGKQTVRHMQPVDRTVQRQQPVSRPGPQANQPQPDHARFQRPPAQQQAQGAAQGQARRVPIPTAPQQGQQAPALPERSRKRRRRPRLGCMAVFIGLFLTFCGGLTLLTTAFGAVAYVRIDQLVEDRFQELDRYANFQSTFIYDRDGEPLFEVFNEGRRTNVDLEDMPQNLINATIAIEDDSFYSNIGIDVGATFVAGLNYLGADAGEDTPGGSTITQQLVRNVLFSPEYAAERSVQRKAEEIVLAIALNARKSKDEILEMYLNEIYYGNLAYGAQAASQIFFDKDVGNLSLGEAALLAGLPQAPADLDPLNPDPQVQSRVTERWREVLNEMVEEGFITSGERDAALSQGLTFANPDIDLRAPHFTVHARQELENLMQELGYGVEEIARGGLRVYTTVDLDMNERVQDIAAQQIASLDPSKDVSNAAVVVTKPLTGEIMAMVGSIDYNNDAIDGHVNVTTRPRQPGSTMKPFTYSAAMELGFTPGDVIWDTPITIPQPGQPDYEPRNYDGSFHGPMRMRYALGNSYNIPAVQTLRYVGVDYLLGLMQRFGVDSLGMDASRYGLSLTLGGGEITLLELTRAYSVFANQGLLVDNTSIRCVLDNDSKVLYEYENGCPQEAGGQRVERTSATVSRTGLGDAVLDERIAFLISNILSDNAARSTEMGANSPLRTPNIGTSVKTGTTNDVKDNWTVGYTRNVAVGVWVGNNDGRPMRGTSGLTGAAPIWNDVITNIYNNNAWMSELSVDGQLMPDQPSPPPGMSQRRICDVRNMYDPVTSCPSNITEWFLDSPAKVPGPNGELVPGQQRQQGQERVPSTGTYVQRVEPGVYRTVVLPLDPAVAQGIQFQVEPGEPTPPPPKYCRVPMEAVSSTPGVQEQLFIAPPRVPRDAVEAERYAQSRGLAFLPTIDCTAELLNAPRGGPAGVTAVITSPQPNQTVNGSMPITGTAQFTPGQQAQYYKLDIIGGQWSNWTTIQDVSRNSVVNGQLGTLPNLPPGSYRLRLVLVGMDGNHMQNPYEVPFNVQ